ncbi:MAG: right-handed parallel beta-helix repeat-containing protein [Lachnospiraceae bacterium]|nr:right-handed parallel beta-helix repeat-containing protein [Lachnospiraceae bacterium]
MQKKKKLLGIFLVLCMLVFSFSGCTKSPQTGGNGTETDPQTGGNGIGIDPDAGKITEEPSQGNGTDSEPTKEPTQIPATPTPTQVPATPTPTEIPKPSGKVYEDGFKSPVAQGKENFDAESLKAEGFTVVTSAQEFIEAIRPGAKIAFAPGKYNLGEYTRYLWDYRDASVEIYDGGTIDFNEYISLIDDFDGIELRIRGVDDLLITGGSENAEDTELVSDASYCAVLSFDKCNNVTIANVKMGHVVTGNCEGNVVDLYRCCSARFYNDDIYGCGVYGIGASKGSQDIFVYDSVIHDCSYGAIEYNWGMGQFVCVNCKLIDTAGITYSETAYSKLIFDRCTLGDWETTSIGYRDDIEVKDCVLGEIQYYPEFEEIREDAPGWLTAPFDPASFDFDSMEYAYDDEYITQSAYYDSYSYWQGYKMIDPLSGKTVLIPSYDVENDTMVNVACGFKSADENEGPDALPRFWLTFDDEYITGTWFYSSAYSVVLQPDEDSGYEDEAGKNAEPWYGTHINASIYRDLDDENSHPWIVMELNGKTVWLY